MSKYYYLVASATMKADVYKRQGLGCSPIKVARELGSERRETCLLYTSRCV